jgi:hypothetical protein
MLVMVVIVGMVVMVPVVMVMIVMDAIAEFVMLVVMMVMIVRRHEQRPAAGTDRHGGAVLEEVEFLGHVFLPFCNRHFI